MTFNKWFDTFIQEKGIDLDRLFVVDGETATNYITAQNVVDQIKAFPKEIQNTTKTKIVQIDFHNGDVMHFFEYIAKKMAQ